MHKIPKTISIIFIIFFFIAILGISMRIAEYVKLYFSTQKQTVLPVAIVKATSNTENEKIILPANVIGWHEATLYARTKGYVINWYVDYGSHVKAGDLLAEIATPEVIDSLHQADAEVKTAEANYHLADITAKRWINLLKTNSVSKQETDDKVSDAKAKAAVLESALANRDRLRTLVNFREIIAPFDGTITSRHTDIGNLINAGAGTTPLFHIVQNNPLRVYVKVPQYYAASIKPNLIAQLYSPEHPKKLFPATLLNTAKAIDPKSRTLLVQLMVDNTNNQLFAGSYVEAQLTLPPNPALIRLPVNTLVFRAEGLQVACIDKENKVILKDITLSRDFGNVVEVDDGLNPGEKIILNPPDSIINGQKVKIISNDDPPS